MKLQQSFPLVVALLMAVAARLDAATLATNWPFTTSSQYVVSDSNKIEVASGAAQLVLQKSFLDTTTRADYLTNAVQLTNVVFGQNANLGLALSNGLYASSGVYTSRVFNGGSDGNIWNGLAMRLSNKGLIPNAASPIKLTDSGIVNDPAALGLYHFDGTWLDEVTSTTGTPYASPVFTNDAFFGSQSLRLNGSNYFATVGSTLLNNRSSGSFVLWMKLLSRTAFGGILVDRTDGFTGFGQEGAKVAFGINNSVVYSTTDIPLNTWCFIAGTFNAGVEKIYFNGKLEGSAVCRATLSQTAPFLVGWNTFQLTWRTDGLFDEVAIYGRELSASEIQNLYTLSGPFGVRLRSGSSPSLAGAFVGPSGGAGSYYMNNLNSLQIAGNFNPADQYLQYEASFYSTSNQLQAPTIDSLKFIGSASEFRDSVWGDFVQGSGSVGATNFPARHDTPFVALGQVGNGVVSNGTFTSRVFDAGGSVNWTRLAWDRGVALSPPILGLEGLWHMDALVFGVWSGSWVDSSGKGHHGSNSGADFSPYPKVGAYAASFNGSNASFNVGNLGSAIQTVEFWMQAELPTMPILELGGTNAWLAVSNNFVTVNGWSGTIPAIYVNGGFRSQLLPGWNHVAVVFPSAVNAYIVTVGAARSGFFKGKLDELAVYTRALTTAEIATDCSVGRRDAAGRIRFQARADTVNPPTAPFVGKDGTTSDYFLDPTGSTALPVSFSGKQYFQYQAILDGDGTVSPALSSVTVAYGAGNTTGDVTKVNFAAGDFGSASTRLVGDEIMLRPLYSSGPANLILANSPSLLGLWHMDDAGWVSGSISVLDSSGLNRHGTPQGSASVQQAQPAVGMKNGAFSSSGYLSIPAATLSTNDFTISGWFKTTSSTRSPLFSSYDVPGQPYFSLELNWDGSLTTTGQAVFVVSDGSTLYPVLGIVKGLNDGAWHHVSGVRNGAQTLLYIDGVLAGSAPTAIGSVGSGALTMAKNGTQTPSAFFSGSLDEFALHGRALTEAEIGDLAASGFLTLNQGIVEGPVMGVGRLVYWKTVGWGCDAPFGRALKPEGSMAGLWHFDSTNNSATTEDSSTNANYGNVAGGVTVDASGRFGYCLNVAAGLVTVPKTLTLLVSSFTMESWVYASNTVSLVVARKHDGSNGFILGTDATGHPTLQVNGTTLADFDVLRGKKWNLLSGTYDGTTAKLYVNGFLKATALVPGPAAADVDLILGGTLNGKMDEAVFYGRAINSREALDHYRAGVCSLKFQVRTWDPGAQGGYVGPDGTANTFFTDYDGSVLTTNSASIAKSFQAKAFLSSEDARFTPKLDSVTVNMEGYPTDNPWVAPTNGFGSGFYGQLTSFAQSLLTVDSTAVRYQLSGDNGTTWYAWSSSSNAWVDTRDSDINSDLQWSVSNPATTIASHITTFYSQLYKGAGGIFKFRAFLKSFDAISQVALDRVDLGYLSGRIVVTAPTGSAKGNNAVVKGSPFHIKWSSGGAVSATNIVIKLYNDTDHVNPLQVVANGVTNNGDFWSALDYPGFVTATNFVLRIYDGNDPLIEDWSDPFEIVFMPHLTQPNGGELWNQRLPQTVTWEWPSDPVIDPTALLWFRPDAGSSWIRLTNGLNQVGTNSCLWTPDVRDFRLLSTSAVMAVSQPLDDFYISPDAAPYYDVSDSNFTMAGIVVTYPNGGIRMGVTSTVQWVSAAVGTNVTIDLSVDGGITWTNLASNVPNEDGANSHSCNVVAGNPSDSALIRVTSLSNTNYYGDSISFALAEINILAPVAGMTWQIGSTNKIMWTSGGASNLVKVSYTTIEEPGVTNLIVMEMTNYNITTTTVTNFVDWIVAGSPSTAAVIRIDALAVPGLYAESDPFKVTGIKLLSPRGDINPLNQIWSMTDTNDVRWLTSLPIPAPSFVKLDIGFTTTNDYELLVDNVVIGTGTRPIFPRNIRRPTSTGKVRITVKGIATNEMQMVDASPNYFTIRGLSLVSPTNSARYTLGTTVANGFEWYSAATGAGVDFFYAPDGSTFTQIATNENNKNTSPNWNQLDWTVSSRLTPTDTAKIMMVSGGYTSISSNFTIRGVLITQPAAGSVWTLGAQTNVSFLSAGMSGAKAVGEISTTGGIPEGSFESGGLPASISVGVGTGGAFLWTISKNLDPTTNAVLRLRVFTNGTDIIANSEPFVLRGLKFLSPATGTNWALGSSQVVSFKAGGLAGARASLYYSSDDGATFDIANPVTNNILLNDGINTVGWTLQADPSTNAMLMMVSGAITNYSSRFTVSGIKVTSPKSGDIWAVSDVVNTIQWASVGATPPFTLWFMVYDTVRPAEIIAANVMSNSYVWTMTNSAIGTNVTITVTDGTMTNESPRFTIVPAPSIRIENPLAGDFWKVGETTNVITWKPGGNMSNDFTVSFWSSKYGLVQVAPPGEFPYTNGLYECPVFSIPYDILGEVHVVISNNVKPEIEDTLVDFRIAPTFEIDPLPFADVYARDVVKLNWLNKGDVSAVDLFYTTDPSNPSNWVPISVVTPPVVGNNKRTYFDWTVPDVQASVWFRVQDQSYSGTRFSVSKKGPYDDYGPFLVKYYPVVWRVYDSSTTNEMTGLSVSDSLGFSIASVDSPVTFGYPAGVFNTIWFKQYFNDKIVLSWKPSAGLTNVVFMNRTEAAPEFHVMATFVYDTSNSVFKTVAWLERSSQIIANPSECSIYMYNPDGVLQLPITTVSVSQTNGVFWADVGAGVDKTRPYFAKVEIKYSGVIYTSGITFSLIAPSDSAIAAVNAAKDLIMGGLSNVNDNVTGVGMAVGAFRGDMTNRLTSLSNTTAQISMDTTGIQSNLLLFSSNALAQLSGITNAVGVIGDGGTNLLDRVAVLTSEVEKRTARILSRPTSVKLGSTFTVMYRTRSGASPKITVTDPVGVDRVSGAGMDPEIGTSGIFEKNVTMEVLWGLGDFTVACSDFVGGPSDRMILKVTAVELDDLAGTMVNVSNQLASVELAMSTMSVSVSNVQITVNGTATNVVGLLTNVVTMEAMMAGLTNMPGQMNFMTNVITQLAGLTNMNTAVTALTNAVGQILVLTNINTQITQLGALTNLSSQMTSVTNAMARLSGITNQINTMSAQLNYVTNVIDQIVVLTNINSSVAAMTGAVAQIVVLTNMASQLNYMTNVIAQVGVLTNLTPQMASLTNSMARLSAVTNQLNIMSGQMDYMSNVIIQVTALTNINSAVSVLTGAVAQITALTNMSGQLNYMTNIIAQVGVLTNLTPQMASLTNSMARLSSVTNQINTMSGQLDYVTNVINQITMLTNINSAVSALTGSVAQITALTNMTGQLNFVTNLVGQLGGLTNLTPQMASLTNSMARLSVVTNLINTMSGQMDYMTNVINQITMLTNINSSVSALTNAVASISGLTNMGSQLNYLTNAMVQVQGLTNLSPQMASVTNLLGRMASLTNLTPQVASLTNMPALLASLTNMPTQMAGLSNVMAQVAGLTNLPAQMADVTNIVSKLTGITNLSAQVSAMTNSIAQLYGLTNMPAQMSDVTNIVSKLTGITNLSAQVSAMTNSIAQLYGLTNMPAQMSDVTNIVSKLTGITNLSAQVSAMTNSIAQLYGLTNMPAQMSDVTNIVSKLSGITNLSAQVSAMTNSIAQLYGLTNMPAQMSDVTNIVGKLSGITNLSDQVSAMTNAIGQIAGLTNMGARLDYLTNSVSQLGGLTNMPGQIAFLTNAVNRLGSLTNITAQVADMTNTLGRLSSLTNLPNQVSNLAASIAQLGNLTNQMTGVVTAIGQLGSLTNLGSTVSTLLASIDQITALTNMSTQVTDLQTSMGKLIGITNMQAQVGQLTGTVAQVATAVAQMGSLTNLGTKVDQLGTSLAQISALTNMVGQVNGLVTAVAQLGSVTNLNAQVADILTTVDAMISLTNLNSRMDNVTLAIDQLGSLTNLGATAAQLVTSIAQITSLTNMSGQVSGLVTGMTDLQSTTMSISNAVAALSGVSGSLQAASNALSAVSGLSALSPALTTVSATVSNLQESISPMQTSLAALTGGLGTASDAAGKETLFGYIYELEKNLNAVGTTAQQAVSRASGARSQANSAAGAAARIKNAVATGQIPQVMSDLAIIRKSLEETLSQVKGIPGQMSTDELVKTLNDASSTMKKMAEGRGVATQAGSAGLSPTQAGSLTDPKAVGELLNKLAETKAMMEATRLLMDEAINKPVVVDWLEGTK